MNRRDVLVAYEDYSRLTSANVRQLSFAALAVVWLFRPEGMPGGVLLPRALLLAAILSICALTCDFLQYVYGTIAWGTLHRSKEKNKVSATEEFEAPHQINWPTNTFFAAKAVFVASAYVVLLKHLSGTLF
ncbi:MAG: hypothetical protein O7E49_11085 [Gemmatimonadetes bacterium]|nr:hypothetical protein [Gemmatimonadota bacterium]